MNPPDARFCEECAAPLAAAVGVPFGYASGVVGGPPPGYAPPAMRAPTRDAPLEMWLEGFVTFDGSVVEQFHFRSNYCGRRHVAVIREMVVHEDGSRLHLDLRTSFQSMNLLIPFRPDQRPQVERLMQAILSAQAARGAGQA